MDDGPDLLLSRPPSTTSCRPPETPSLGTGAQVLVRGPSTVHGKRLAIPSLCQKRLPLLLNASPLEYIDRARELEFVNFFFKNVIESGLHHV